MDKKIIWIIVIIVVLFLVIAGAGIGTAYYLGKKVVKTPSPTPSATPSETPSPFSEMTLEEVKAQHCLKNPNGGTGNITIANIAHYATFDSPIFVEGTANVFEGSFSIRLVDCDGKKISEVNAQTEAGEVGVSKPYSANIIYNDSYIGTYATIEAYDLSMM